MPKLVLILSYAELRKNTVKNKKDKTTWLVEFDISGSIFTVTLLLRAKEPTEGVERHHPGRTSRRV